MQAMKRSEASIAAENQQMKAILDALAEKHPVGMTMREIQAAMKRALGYKLTEVPVRNRLQDLIDEGKCYQSIQKGKNGAHLFVFGQPPKDYGQVGKPETAKVAVHPSSAFQYLDRMEKRLEKIEKQIRTLLIRSEYSTPALIAISAIAKELGVKVELPQEVKHGEN